MSNSMEELTETPMDSSRLYACSFWFVVRAMGRLGVVVEDGGWMTGWLTGWLAGWPRILQNTGHPRVVAVAVEMETNALTAAFQ